MAFSRLVFTVLLLSASCYANDVVPVFIWGDQTTPIKINPLETTPSNEFSEIIQQVLVDYPFTVVFVEPTLSPEDISSKNSDGSSPLSFLAQKAKSGHFRYLSAVDSPLKVISELIEPKETERIILNENEITDIKSSDSKYLIIELQDAREGETRIEMLERHNEFIQETFKNIKEQHEDVVGVYTGHYPSWEIQEIHSRVRRQAAASNETEDFILEGVRLYVQQIQLRDGDSILNFTNNPTSSMTVNDTEHTMSTTVSFGDRSFVMNFRTKGGYWFFDSVTVNPGAANEESLYPTTNQLFALEGFSYRCGQTTVFNNVFSNTSRTLTFNNLQIQPFFTSINSSVQFGDSFDCVGFFSAPIWAGLMVTFILLAITFYGIMMMMDIRTMDRFDDPKGKTITINTSE